MSGDLVLITCYFFRRLGRTQTLQQLNQPVQFFPSVIKIYRNQFQRFVFYLFVFLFLLIRSSNDKGPTVEASPCVRA